LTIGSNSVSISIRGITKQIVTVIVDKQIVTVIVDQ